MSAEKAIFSLLSNDAGVAALVQTRVYPSVLDDGCTYPAIVYQRVSGVRIHGVLEDPGSVTARIQVTVYAGTYKQAHQVADAVRLALKRKVGTFGGIEVWDIKLDNDNDLPFIPGLDLYPVAMDFIVDHKE